MPNARKLSIRQANATGLANHEKGGDDVESSRFQVNKVKSLEPDDGGDEGHGDSNQLTYVYDSNHHKSISQITREALPKLDHYRDPASINNQQRPTLDELHYQVYNEKVIFF